MLSLPLRPILWIALISYAILCPTIALVILYVPLGNIHEGIATVIFSLMGLFAIQAVMSLTQELFLNAFKKWIYYIVPLWGLLMSVVIINLIGIVFCIVWSILIYFSTKLAKWIVELRGTGHRNNS